MRERDALAVAGVAILGLVGVALIFGERRSPAPTDLPDFTPIGPPRPLGRTDDYGTTQSATIFVGMDRGLEPSNTRGVCAVQPKKFGVLSLDREFLKVRRDQVGKQNTGGTRTTGKGWYQGKAEKAAAYEIVFIASKREKSYKHFRGNMNRMAEKMGKKFCQDAVIVVHNDGDKRKSCGAVWYAPGKGSC